MKSKKYFYILILIVAAFFMMNELNMMRWTLPFFMTLAVIVVLSVQRKIDQRKDEVYYHNLDIMKYVFSMLIIILHLRPFFQSHQLLDIAFNNVITRICVPMYFMITGYFVCIKEKEDDGYIKKYIRKMIPLYILWSLFYLPFLYQYGQGLFQQLLSAVNIEGLPVLKVLFIPGLMLIGLFYGGVYYHLWYFPAVMMALWIVAQWKKRFSVRSLLFIALFLLIVGASETYYGVLPSSVRQWSTYYFRVFFTTRNFLFFGLFYVTLGYAMAKRKVLSQRYCFIKMAGSVMLLVVETALLYHSQRLDSNILLSCIPLSYYLFVSLIYLKNERVSSFPFALLSKYYYLLHPMIIVFVQTFFTGIETMPLGNLLCVVALTHVASCLAIKLQYIYQQSKIKVSFENLLN